MRGSDWLARWPTAWDAAGPGEGPALLEQFKRGLATRAYLKTVIDDLGNTLGEVEGGSVMGRIVGIDLGTTNSLVAYVDDKTGLPLVIPDKEGHPLLPSVVAFMPGGILVGESAKRQLVRRPHSTVYSVKRFMGRDYDDVKEELQLLPIRRATGRGDRPARGRGP